jgi:hypothetical protein
VHVSAATALSNHTRFRLCNTLGIYSLPSETHAAFTRWNAPLSSMCQWWRDGGAVLPQVTFKGANCQRFRGGA